MDFNQLAPATPQIAQRLLGSKLITDIKGIRTSCIITETEFYHQDDAASHTFGGKTKRNQSMFLEAGHAYVYFIYGMHYCLNVVCGQAGEGTGVLIRGGVIDEINIVGPARLARALNVDRTLDGHHLSKEPLQLELQPKVDTQLVTAKPRVGISKAVDKPWRYILNYNDLTQQ